MSTDLVQQSTVYSRASIEQRGIYAQQLAGAGALLPEHLRGGTARDPATNQMVQVGSVGKVFMIAETGDMLGIHPMAALSGVHIIEGKPAISANLMSGLVRKAGHKLRVTVEGTVRDGTIKVTATLIRHDDPEFPFTVVWDLGRAERAGLWPGKERSNWQKYPEAMLKARAISEIIREGASDVLIGGNVYTPEELGAEVTEEGEPINFTVIPDGPVPGRAPSQGGTPAPATPPTENKVQPKEQPPIADEATGETSDDTPDYTKLISELASSEQTRDLYRAARQAGHLGIEIVIPPQRKPRTVEEHLTAVGKKLAETEAEMARAAEARATEPQDDDDVVHATIEPDDTPMVLGDQS